MSLQSKQNDKIFTMISFLTVAFIMFLCSNPMHASSPEAVPSRVGDRLVVQIGAEIYTQRQIEGFLIVQEALDGHYKSSRLNLVDLKTWESRLDVFVFDAIILQGARRAGRFVPIDQRITETLAIVAAKKASDPNFEAKIKALDISIFELKEYGMMYLQISSFRQLPKEDETKWFEEIRSSLNIRYYDNARKEENLFFPSRNPL